MNTGIQDAFNLAWKIAYTHKKLTGKKNLLNSYEKERHELGKKLLKGTERASKFITLNSPFLIFLRKHLIAFLLSFKCVQKFMVKTISEVTIKCGNRRMEDVMLDYNGRDKTFYSATEGSTKFHLILFGIEDPPINHPQIDVLIAKNRSVQKAVLVRPDGYIAIEDSPPFKQLSNYKI
jgi:hypothetical protein